MITVIVGTNRRNSNSTKVAEVCKKILQDKGQDVQLYDLVDLEDGILHPDMFDKGALSEELKAIQDKYLIEPDKFLFVVPEYNGGFPGVLKLFIDACSTRLRNETYQMKKACLVGVSLGRAGNLRGLGHLADVLNYLGTVVYPNLLPISSFSKLLDDNGQISDKGTLEVLESLMDKFSKF